MRVLSLLLILLALTVLHPGVAIVVAAVAFLLSRKSQRKTPVPRAALVRPAERIRTRTELLEERFGERMQPGSALATSAARSGEAGQNLE